MLPALTVLGPAVSLADITVQGGGLIAKPGSASVMLGDSVRIQLIGIRPGGQSPVRFRITTEPEFGKLSKIEPDFGDTSRAWVVYSPNPDAGAGTDSFSFNAKIAGANASPSAKISLVLEDPVAALRVNPVLPFGKVEIGTVARLPLKISNDGTKAFVARLNPPAPWSIPEKQRNLRVEAGESATVDVSFAPVDLKPQRYSLILQSGNPDGAVQLAGAGASPFGKPFGTLDLAWDAVGGRRSAGLRIANLTDRKLPLKLSAALPLEIDSVIVLEPKEARTLPVSVSGIGTYRGTLTISSEYHAEAMQVRARPTPAKIRVLKPEEPAFNFELMDTDTPPVHEVVVLNEGGSKAFIYAETARPFYVVEGGDPTELAPGKTMTIKASMDPREVGTFERSLSILGTANKIDFQLSALVTRNVDRSQVGVNLPELAPLISSQQAKLLEVLPDFKTRLRGKNDKRRVVKSEIPSVGKIYLENQGKRELVLSWDHPGSPDLDYILEVEVYKREEDALPSVTWYQASENVTVIKDDQGARMTLKKLQPGRQFRIRILTINKAGHSSRPSRAELVYTLPPGRRAMWLLPFFLVLGGGGFYVWRRRQQF